MNIGLNVPMLNRGPFRGDIQKLGHIDWNVWKVRKLYERKKMKLILESTFGSTIYGTALPSSDKDYKGIFIPSTRDIILQRAKRTIQEHTKLDEREKNTKDDVDRELFSVQEFCRLLSEGQTPALDLLFAPEKYHSIRTPEFDLIKENKALFLSQKADAFIGYTKTQAAKYGIKGFRVAALEETLKFLNSYPNEYLKLIHTNVLDFVKKINNDHIKIVQCKGPNNTPTNHLEVCGKKYSFSSLIKYVKERIQKSYDNYGHRALLAQKNEGVDWKAIYHAIRVSHEVEELLLTGNITFPRPEASLLLQVRQGLMSYNECAKIIEARLNEISNWQAKSILPKDCNYEKIDELVYYIYEKNMFKSLEDA